MIFFSPKFIKVDACVVYCKPINLVCGNFAKGDKGQVIRALILFTILVVNKKNIVYESPTPVSLKVGNTVGSGSVEYLRKGFCPLNVVIKRVLTIYCASFTNFCI